MCRREGDCVFSGGQKNGKNKGTIIFAWGKKKKKKVLPVTGLSATATEPGTQKPVKKGKGNLIPGKGGRLSDSWKGEKQITLFSRERNF